MTYPFDAMWTLYAKIRQGLLSGVETMIDPLLRDYSTYPRMAHWFSPSLLLKLLNNVIVSSMFGQYADRRLMIAALDTVSATEHINRATALMQELKPDDQGAIWIDWVADLGDGFDSTFAVASLLAQKELKIGDDSLPRGQALIMGGDEVYPTASREAYMNQLRQPYAWALPDHDRKADEGIPLYAIPGNHDWYDGLALFLAFFCRPKPWHIGGWRTQQRRSYFALQLTDTWWLWATDIQLADDMDLPQADYFKSIAEAMPRDAKIILCGAEPGWLYTDTNSKSWEIMDYAIGIADKANRGLKVPLLLSGDTHHYSRYSAKNGTQFITSGGGGAFLHPTHQLEDHISVKWMNVATPLSLKTAPAAGHPPVSTAACYPSKSESRKLLVKNLFFALKNWDFSFLMGAIYFIMAVGLTLRDQWDAYIIVASIFVGAITGYTYHQEKSGRAAVLISSVIHALIHTGTVIWFSRFFADWNDAHLVLTGQWYSVWKWLSVLLIEMGAVGFLGGSTIFGLNLLITCGLLRMNHNDAFSAFRQGTHNNFLRLRIKGDHVEVFAIGLKDVPARDGWVANAKAARGKADEPVFLPVSSLKPHLIEKVIV